MNVCAQVSISGKHVLPLNHTLEQLNVPQHYHPSDIPTMSSRSCPDRSASPTTIRKSILQHPPSHSPITSYRPLHQPTQEVPPPSTSSQNPTPDTDHPDLRHPVPKRTTRLHDILLPSPERRFGSQNYGCQADTTPPQPPHTTAHLPIAPISLSEEERAILDTGAGESVRGEVGGIAGYALVLAQNSHLGDRRGGEASLDYTSRRVQDDFGIEQVFQHRRTRSDGRRKERRRAGQERGFNSLEDVDGGDRSMEKAVAEENEARQSGKREKSRRRETRKACDSQSAKKEMSGSEHSDEDNSTQARQASTTHQPSDSGATHFAPYDRPSRNQPKRVGWADTQQQAQQPQSRVDSDSRQEIGHHIHPRRELSRPTGTKTGSPRRQDIRNRAEAGSPRPHAHPSSRPRSERERHHRSGGRGHSRAMEGERDHAEIRRRNRSRDKAGKRGRREGVRYSRSCGCCCM